MSHVLARRMAVGFATSLDRPSGPRIELLPVWLTAGIEGVAQLLEGRFRLRVGDRAARRVDGDFELIMRMPQGYAACWRFDWNRDPGGGLRVRVSRQSTSR
jgi:hypothetical protein